MNLDLAMTATCLPPGFEPVQLDEHHVIGRAVLPRNLIWTEAQFQAAWSEHPIDFHTIKMFGKEVSTPRWQQAYGVDYRYTGRVNRALTMPPWLEPLAKWATTAVAPDLNGALVNFYDAKQGHYIGPHRDSEAGRIRGTPILTLSFGAPRVFRLRRHSRRAGGPPHDLEVEHGGVLLLPWATNGAFTHEVLKPASPSAGDRISVTLRAFF